MQAMANLPRQVQEILPILENLDTEQKFSVIDFLKEKINTSNFQTKNLPTETIPATQKKRFEVKSRPMGANHLLSREEMYDERTLQIIGGHE